VAEPLVLNPQDGRALDIFGAALTLKATSAETGGAYSLIEGAYQPDSFVPLPHVHRDQDESFYVLEGQFDFRVGAAIIRGTVGTFLHVPAGTLHGFVNAGDSLARVLFIHSPALEGFFLELGELAAAGPPDMQTLPALIRAWGMDVVTS
jgi:quercetin dioxygenase-like cupin family protein